MSVRSFLVDYRVVISFVLFTTLILAQIYVGTKPHGWWVGGEMQGLFGASLVLIGLAIRSWAAGVLIKGRTLATSGPYSLCKHPLYLGSFSMMLGFAVLLGNPLIFAVVFGPVTIIYWLTMLSEERKLAERFDDNWKLYSQRVPRFLPWRWASYQHAPFSLTRWVSNREYKAMFTAILSLIALELWRLN